MNNYKIVTKAYCSDYKPKKYVDVGIYFVDKNDESNIMSSIMLNSIIGNKDQRTETYFGPIISIKSSIQYNHQYVSEIIPINKNSSFKIVKNKNKLTFILNNNSDEIELSNTFNISILIDNNSKEIIDMLQFLIDVNTDLTRGFK